MAKSLALDELDAVPVLAAEQQASLEELLDAVDRFQAVEVDRPVGPLAAEPQLTPGLDVRMPTQPRLRIDRIELRQRQAFDRVVLVDEHHRGGRLAQGAPAARRDADRERLVAELVDEGLLLGRQQLAAHRSEVRAPFGQRRAAGARSPRFHGDAEFGIRLAEQLDPAQRDLVHDVRADQVERLLRLARDLARLPDQDRGIDFEPMLWGRVLQRERGCGDGGDEGRKAEDGHEAK